MSIKIVVDISESEIRTAIETSIRAAVEARLKDWKTEKYIAFRVEQEWNSNIDAHINEALLDFPALKEKIAQEVEAKLKRQISAVMKAAAQQ